MEPINSENSDNNIIQESHLTPSTPYSVVPPAAPVSSPTYTYAGFWYRFAAAFIDGIILYFVRIIPIAVLNVSAYSYSNSFTFTDSNRFFGSSLGAFTLLSIGSFIIYYTIDILYHSLLEASSWQGSIGKKALGLIVTDEQGYKLNFQKAFFRNLFKLISGLTFLIGYIMAGFTQKKQALHDILANTLVLKRV